MKEKYIDFFNSLLRGRKVDLNLLTSAVSEYLTDINCEKTSEMINLLTQHPEIVSMFNIIDKITEHLCKKYSINWITLNNPNAINNQIILYYGQKR